MKLKLIDGDKTEAVEEQKKAVFTTGVGLHRSGLDYDVYINGELVMWFTRDGKIKYNEYTLEQKGFEVPVSS